MKTTVDVPTFYVNASATDQDVLGDLLDEIGHEWDPEEDAPESAWETAGDHTVALEIRADYEPHGFSGSREEPPEPSGYIFEDALHDGRLVVLTDEGVNWVTEVLNETNG